MFMIEDWETGEWVPNLDNQLYHTLDELIAFTLAKLDKAMNDVCDQHDKDIYAEQAKAVDNRDMDVIKEVLEQFSYTLEVA